MNISIGQHYTVTSFADFHQTKTDKASYLGAVGHCKH